MTTTTTDAVSVNATQAGPRPIDGGWVRPAWATEHSFESGRNNSFAPMQISWTCDGSIAFVAKDPGDDRDGDLSAPSLTRWDEVSFDLDDGTMIAAEGEIMIYVHDNLEVSPAEARKLAAALIELADIAEGATS